MKLLPKLNLLTVSVLLLMMISVVAVGYVIIGDIISSHNRRILATEMDNLSASADRGRRILLRAGVAHVAGYVTRMKEQLYGEYVSYRFGRTGSLLVLEGGRAVFGDEGQGATVASVLASAEIVARGAGYIEFSHGGEERFGAWKAFPAWDWVLVLSMTRQEMFEKRTDYLTRVSAIALGILLLNWLLTNLYVRRQVGRVRSALDVVGRVGLGDLNARIKRVESGDEIGELQHGINSMAADIAGRTAERDRVEMELLQSETKYRSLFENSVNGIFQTTPEGRYLSVNPALARILGHDSPDDVMALNAFKIYDDPDDRLQLLEHLRRDGAVTGFETRLLRRDGSAIWVSINARAVRNEDGSLSVMEGSCADNSARKRAEEELATVNRHLEELVEHRTSDLAAKARELESANRRLRELDELKSAFLSSVSHELRTPLTSIMGWAITLQSEKLQQKDMLNDGLGIIAKESERLTRMVEELLDFSKFVSGRIKLEYENVNLAELLQHIKKQLTPRAVRESIDFSVVYPENLPEIWTDANRLKQLFINILDNAFNFTDAGGSVRFQTEAGEKEYTFTISDSGCGISGEELPLVKNKFYKGKSSQSQNGIGLSICEEIVTLMGGRLAIESELNVGTTVVITLPKEVCANG